MDSTVNQFISKVRLIHKNLNIPESFASGRNLPLQAEATELIEVWDADADKTFKLTPSAATSWKNLKNAARADGVSLILVSGYRGLEYQSTLIEKKVLNGQDILEILKVLAPPGYSEHHTGKAVDLTTENCPPCVERFEKTEAFSWLQNNAGKYDFSLSYPRDNPYGFIYEPWHWAYRG